MGRRKTSWGLWLVAGIGVLVSAACMAPARPMALGNTVLAPQGFAGQASISEKWRTAFAPTAAIAQTRPIHLDEKTRETLDRVNLTVDRTLRGRPFADCKTHVLAKRRALTEAGIPFSTLSIAIVRTRREESHAVLLIATDEGDLVLDNLSGWITPWQETGYRWVARQMPGAPSRWVEVEQVASAAP